MASNISPRSCIRQTREWIAWTPQGYYVSSVHGDQLIGWHLNRGRDRSALFYRAVQFERLLYRPDIVDAAFAARDPRPAVAAPRRERAFDIAELRRIAPPLVRLRPRPPIPAPRTPPRARVRIDAQAVSLPMRDLTVYVNNVPITPSRARPLGASDAQSVAREVEVDLAEAENVVRVEISNGESLGLDEIVVDAARPLRPLPDPGRRLVFARGRHQSVSRSSSPTTNRPISTSLHATRTRWRASSRPRARAISAKCMCACCPTMRPSSHRAGTSSMRWTFLPTPARATR